MAKVLGLSDLVRRETLSDRRRAVVGSDGFFDDCRAYPSALERFTAKNPNSPVIPARFKISNKLSALSRNRAHSCSKYSLLILHSAASVCSNSIKAASRDTTVPGFLRGRAGMTAICGVMWVGARADAALRDTWECEMDCGEVCELGGCKTEGCGLVSGAGAIEKRLTHQRLIWNGSSGPG